MSRVKAGDAYVSINADNSGLINGLRVAHNSINRFSTTSRVVIAVGLDDLKYAVNQLTDLQDQILTLRGVTGAGASALEGLEAAAKKLGATTSWTAGEVAAGMVSLARLGQTTEQISASIAPVMELARSIGVSVDDAASAVGASLNQFRLSADSAAHVVDVYAAATNGAAISENQLAESMKYAGTAAGSVGQSLEDTVAMVSTFRNLGYSAEQAGTLVKSLFSELQRGKQSTALENLLDVGLRDSGGGFRALLDVLAEGQSRAAEFGETLQARLLGSGFSVEASTALTALVNNLDATRTAAAGLKDVDGYASQLSATMESGLNGSISLVRSAVDGLSISVAETFSGSFQDALKVTADAVSAVAEFTRANSSGIAAVAKTGVTVAAAVASFKGLGAVVRSASSAVNVFRDVLRGLDGVKIGGRGSALSSSDLTAGLMKARTSGDALLSQFQEIRRSVGDAAEAQKRFSAQLSEGGKMATNEAAAVADVTRRVDAGEISQKRFNSAVKAAGRSASALVKTLKGVGGAVAGLVAVEVIVQAGKAFYDYFQRAAEKAREVREQMEAAAAEQRRAREESFKSSGATERAETVRGVIDDARRYMSMTLEEQGAAQQRLKEAVRNGVISQQQLDAIDRASVSDSMTADDWGKLTQTTLTASLQTGAQQASTAASEVADSTLRGVLNSALGANSQNLEELRERVNSGPADGVSETAGAKLAGAIQTAVVAARAVQSSNLSDADKRVRIADIKAQARQSIALQKTNAADQLQTLGGAGVLSLNRADRAAYKRVQDAAELALSTFEEAVDAATEAAKYAATASAEAQKSAQSAPGATVDPFSFLDAPTGRASTANASQLGETVDAVEPATVDADEAAAEAARQRAAADKESARTIASEAVARLRGMDAQEITLARVKNAIQKIDAAERAGVDVSADREGLRDFFAGLATSLKSDIKIDYQMQSRVMQDAVSAAFSLSNNTAADAARQQLAEARRTNDALNRQTAALEEIINLL